MQKTLEKSLKNVEIAEKEFMKIQEDAERNICFTLKKQCKALESEIENANDKIEYYNEEIRNINRLQPLRLPLRLPNRDDDDFW